jgi:hypothetical protein
MGSIVRFSRPQHSRFITVNVNTINPDEDEAPSTQGKGAAAIAESDICALGVHGADALYAEVRDQHVEKFGSFLQNQAVALRESHANFTSTGKKKDLSEIHQFVKQIPVRARLYVCSAFSVGLDWMTMTFMRVLLMLFLWQY